MIESATLFPDVMFSRKRERSQKDSDEKYSESKSYVEELKKTAKADQDPGELSHF